MVDSGRITGGIGDLLVWAYEAYVIHLVHVDLQSALICPRNHLLERLV